MKIYVNFREGIKNIFIKSFLILTLFHALDLQAQTPPGDCPCDPDDSSYDACAALYPECDHVVTIPVSTDVKWLLCSGVVLVFYALHKNRKDNPEKPS